MTPEIVIAFVGAAALVLGGLVTYFGTRGKTKADAKSALDTRIDARVKTELERVYTRLDEVENAAVKRASAFARILRAIADQWQGDPRGPNLDPADIREVEDTIPPQWIRRHPELNPNLLE
ncbi:hypothetical protein [Herbiconiux solani]|uniref:hypothetical protein n=1 Tax=Herbiconiux solani TaxID=661329 RepID=UPI000825FEC0|nr:hypothetical protein [Herbiconiux solani]